MSAFTLRILAVCLMIVDHAAIALPLHYPLYLLMRGLGRLAFPLFAFLIANGYRYTKNPTRYGARLLICGLLSEVPFDLFFLHTPFSPQRQNVFFTLFLGLLAIYACDLFRKRRLRLPMAVLAIAAVLGADLLRTDGGGIGVLMILAFYLLPARPFQIAICAVFACRNLGFSLLRSLKNALLSAAAPVLSVTRSDLLALCAVLAIIPILLYNHKKGPTPTSRAGALCLKYGFYLLYPLHLLLLSLV